MTNIPDPLYLQIKNEILYQIETNQLHPGDKLPTESQLTEQFHVSRFTISRALRELKEEGILVSNSGKGTFIGTIKPTPWQPAKPSANIASTPDTPPAEIACIFPCIEDTFALSIINGLQSAFPQNQYIFHLFQSITPAMEKNLLYYCLTKQIAGVALYTHEKSTVCSELLSMTERNYPIVLIDRNIPSLNSSYVVGDHEAAGALCIRHLHSLGHTRIAFVTTSGKDAVATNLRIAGVKKESYCSNARHTTLKIIEYLNIHKDIEYYIKTFQKLIFEDRITAFIASGGNCCTLLYQIFKAMKLEIPNDVSLISFDNPQADFPIMNYFTYIDQSEYTIGREAGNILRKKLEQNDMTCYHKVIPPHLVVNRSTSYIR